MNRRTVLKITGVALLQGLARPLAAWADGATSRPTTGPNSEATMSDIVKVKVFNAHGELIGPIETPRVTKTDEQWQAQLTPKQYGIARAKGTEPAFCGKPLD